METPAAAPTDAPASASETPAAPSPGSCTTIIEKLHARRDKVRVCVVMTIDEDSNAEIVWNTPSMASHLAHLGRMFDVKLQRLYARGMFGQKDAPPGPVAGVQGNDRPLPPKIANAIAAAERRVHKAKGSKQRQDRALNPHRKQGK